MHTAVQHCHTCTLQSNALVPVASVRAACAKTTFGACADTPNTLCGRVMPKAVLVPAAAPLGRQNRLCLNITSAAAQCRAAAGSCSEGVHSLLLVVGKQSGCVVVKATTLHTILSS